MYSTLFELAEGGRNLLHEGLYLSAKLESDHLYTKEQGNASKFSVRIQQNLWDKISNSNNLRGTSKTRFTKDFGSLLAEDIKIIRLI